MKKFFLALTVALTASTAIGQANQNITLKTSDPGYVHAVKYQGAYASGTTYSANDLVLSGGIFYLSQGNSNLGNTPATNTSWWQAWSGSGGSSVVATSGTVYLSQVLGATKVASVQRGTDATGMADSITAVNAAFALHPSVLVVDGAFAVSGTIGIPSNTLLYCPTRADGFIGLPNSNANLVMNATSVTNPMGCSATTSSGVADGKVVSNQCDRNISVVGCMLNSNSVQAVPETTSSSAGHRLGADGQCLTGLRFLGVDNFIIRDTDSYDSPCYHYAFDNVSNGVLDNASGADPDAYITPLVPKNTDIYHFNGPSHDVRLQNAKIGPNTDDCVAFNANDWYTNHDSTAQAHWNGNITGFTGWTTGPIERMFVSNVNMDRCANFMRILSAGQRVDEIHVDNITGTVQSYVSQITHFDNAGSSNIGTVTEDRVNVVHGANNFFGISPSHYVDLTYSTTPGTMDYLRLGNISVGAFQYASPFLEMDSGHLGTLAVPNLDTHNTSGAQLPSSAYMLLHGTIDSANVTGGSWLTNPSIKSALMAGTGPTQLNVSGLSTNNPMALFDWFNGGTGTLPGTVSGDALTPNYFVDTRFDEAATGTALGGIVPRITFRGPSPLTGANGAGVAWENAAASWTSDGPTGRGLIAGMDTSPAVLDIGRTAGYVVTLNAANPTNAGELQPLFRYADPTHYMVVDFSGGNVGLSERIGGTYSTIGASTCAAGFTGTIRIEVYLSGYANIRTDQCNLSVTLPTTGATVTATRVGFQNYVAPAAGATQIIRRFSVTDR